MATTTTNFSFPIPQSTDLVKDGATAIAALGTSVDTQFVDLKGGTTGQVLAKASGTDLDFTWIAQDDSNAIQNAIVDAKGDLIAATAADTPARLAVGANNYVLSAASAESIGLKWVQAGLTLITRTTFSGVATQNFDSVFTSSYRNYIVHFDAIKTDTNGVSLNMKMRSAGSTLSNSYYGAMSGASYLGTSKIVGTNNLTGFVIHDALSLNADQNNLEMTFTIDSATSQNPRYTARVYSGYDATQLNGGGGRNASAAMDGFQIYAGSGNVSGTVSIYGLAM